MASQRSQPKKAAKTKTKAKPKSAARSATKVTAKKRAPARKSKPPGTTNRERVTLLVGTRKGAFLLNSDGARQRWSISAPQFLGHIIYHVIADPRDPKHWLLSARTGHLGPTLYISDDGGKNWREAKQPPAFPKLEAPEQGRVVNHSFWLTAGHSSEPGVFYAGTSPHGLFRSEDGGDTWQGVSGFNDNPMRVTWGGGDQGGTPEGPRTHSVLIDPRDPAHMYIGLSSGGVFESRDRGGSWQPLNADCAADFMPDPNPEYGHDPHCVRLHPLDPDLLYQQNHCGIYRMRRDEARWVRIGNNMPKQVGDIGFPVVLHPRDTQKLWVFPMDGTSVWPRTSPDGKPAVYMSADGGSSWQRQDRGLPRRDAWLTVLRQAMTADNLAPLGLYFGTTSGEIWSSRNEGGSWTRIAEHLPTVFSVEALVQ